MAGGTSFSPGADCEGEVIYLMMVTMMIIITNMIMVIMNDDSDDHAHPVLVHGAQRSASQLLGLLAHGKFTKELLTSPF